MAHRLGVDLIEKERFAGLIGRSGLARRFSGAEIAYAERSGSAEEALAAAFAAKEAFFKAASGVLGEDMQGVFWQAELLRDPSGRPRLSLPEALRERLAKRGFDEVEISVTHNRTMVLAAVLLSNSGDLAENTAILQEIAPKGFVDLRDDLQRIDERLAASWLPVRDMAAHKGDFGHTLIVGGSRAYPGAVQMAAIAALKAGAGLVTMCAPDFVASPTAEVICYGVPAERGYLDEAAAEDIAAQMAGKIGVIGMGLGREAATLALCGRLFAKPSGKVIDADGLYALAQLQYQPKNAVLTPHEGEMARLLGKSVEEVAADRLAAVREAAQKYQAVVVLKGARSLVAAPDGRLWQNTTGNPGMATGGSGDVLSGIIGAWLAQGMEPREAAAFGVYLHGLAGDLAAAELSEYALSALDIVRYLPKAYRRLLKIKYDGGMVE